MQRVLYYAAAIFVAVTLLVGGLVTFGLGLLIVPAIPSVLPYGRDQIALTDEAWAQMRKANVAGMERADAQDAMEAIAWKQYDCPGRYEDIYLIGSKDPDYLNSVFIRYDSDGQPLETEGYASWEDQEKNRSVEEFVSDCRIVYSR